jgi:mannose-6-phosphate isomerase-like protein (cupin superfamily)
LLRATTDLDPEELRREGGDRDRLGVKLDDERMAVGPGGAVLIPPGVWHRAAGRMTILNVVVPPFDPNDERID